jgi:hypothetical protein
MGSVSERFKALLGCEGLTPRQIELLVSTAEVVLTHGPRVAGFNDLDDSFEGTVELGRTPTIVNGAARPSFTAAVRSSDGLRSIKFALMPESVAV